jgi:hypothetical protein
MWGRSWEIAVRAVVLLLIAFASLVAAPAALAMPHLFESVGSGSVDLGPVNRNAIIAGCILGAFICAVVLLPDFDGRQDEDWGFGSEEPGRPY